MGGGKRTKPVERKLSTEGISLYATLGLNKDATPEEIKKAYRSNALRYHPDKNPDDPSAHEKIRDINLANAVLSDVKKKELYDAYGSMGLSLAEQIGEENVRMYFMVQSKGFKIGIIICGILTGCYCCCCCCFCCKPCRKVNQDIETEAELDAEIDGDHKTSAGNTTQPRPDVPTDTEYGTPRGFDRDHTSSNSPSPVKEQPR